ncbi:MAG: FKBP-type peptidyl-prolyl cis-trans isomerase [bacterium]|nr:FKBP-type peptidyl-prolyl cis-trans isomerase [bacterium]
MANRSQRAIALSLALLFFATSVATTAYVIWEINKEEPVATGTEIEDNSITNDNQPTPEGEQLKGTQLAGFTLRTAAVTELEKSDTVVGTGDEALAGSTIIAHYTLAGVADGIVIESSLDAGTPLNRPLSGLIPGWQQGIPGMKVGGKRRLVVPANLAYNDGKDLVFDIELLGVQ